MQTTDNTSTTLVPLPGQDLFAFGDSLSDIGRLFTMTQGQIPPSPYFGGRSSNGRLAVEFLADQLGLSHSQAVNFALIGALTGTTNSSSDDLNIDLGGLQDQIEQFAAEASSLGADANDMYFVWAGANDFLSLIETPTTDITSVVTTAVTNIVTAVSTLATLGAKNIVVAQLPNLGLVPFSLQSGLQEAITQLTIAFNTALADNLTTLESRLGGGINVILTDLFATSTAIAADPDAFGFDNITDAYLNGLTPVDDTIDPNTYFFWDRGHPTTAVHKIFSETFYDSIITAITDSLTKLGNADNNGLIGFAGDDIFKGRKGDDQLVGNGGDDDLSGNSGSDALEGGAGSDRLKGGGSNDTLTGGRDSDTLLGQGGTDTLIGVDPTSDTPGQGEMDLLTGGPGPDTFVLGNETIHFYDDGRSNRRGFKDFAVITDLRAKDTIQLNGEINDYIVRQSPSEQYPGTGIFRLETGKKELIGIIADQTDISLDATNFSFAA